MAEKFKQCRKILLAFGDANRQRLILEMMPDGAVTAKSGSGFYTKMNLGIVKYHFELAAGKENFRWE